MNAPLPPQEAAWAARVLKGYIDSIVPLRARPGASAWLRRELRELERRALRPVEFAIQSYCKGHDEARRLLAEDLEPVAAHGGKREQGDNVTLHTDSERGTATTYTVRRLKRDNPELAYADGKLIPFTGRGLLIAHQAITALQHDATLDVASLAPDSPRPDSVVREALRRAGVAADRVDHRLGAAVAALAMRKGKIIATSSAVERVICVAFNSTTSCARETVATFTTEL